MSTPDTLEQIAATTNQLHRNNLAAEGLRFLMPVEEPEVPLLAMVHAETTEVRRERAYLDARQHRADRFAAMWAAEEEAENPPALAIVLPFRTRND